MLLIEKVFLAKYYYIQLYIQMFIPSAPSLHNSSRVIKYFVCLIFCQSG